MLQYFTLPAVKAKGIVELTAQFGGVDIRQAFKDGVISGDLDGLEGNYNEIQDPASILGKPSDIFHAMRMKAHIDKSSGASSKSAAVTPSGEPTE